MAHETLKRVVGLPAELRLQVMEANLLNYKPAFDMTDTDNAKNIARQATVYFDGDDLKHSDKATYDIYKRATEEAFFRTAIFKICLEINQPDLNFTRNFEAALLEPINYIHINMRASPSRGYLQALLNVAKTWKIIETRLPKLKTCILTLELRTCEEDYSRSHAEVGMHALRNDNKPFPGRLLVAPDLPDSEPKVAATLKTTLARIFGDFAENRPAQRCFARIVHEQYDRQSCLLRRHYGYMMPVHPADADTESQLGSSGERILFDAYRCARTVDPNIDDLDPESDILEELSLGDMFGA